MDDEGDENDEANQHAEETLPSEQEWPNLCASYSNGDGCASFRAWRTTTLSVDEWELAGFVVAVAIVRHETLACTTAVGVSTASSKYLYHSALRGWSTVKWKIFAPWGWRFRASSFTTFFFVHKEYRTVVCMAHVSNEMEQLGSRPRPMVVTENIRLSSRLIALLQSIWKVAFYVHSIFIKVRERERERERRGGAKEGGRERGIACPSWLAPHSRICFHDRRPLPPPPYTNGQQVGHPNLLWLRVTLWRGS